MAACSLDLFQHCRFLRYLGNVMALMVLALIGLSYYSVTIELLASAAAAPSLLQRAACATALAAFNVLVFMLLWSYFAAMLTDPGRVPRGWHPFGDHEQAVSHMEALMYHNASSHDKRNVWRPRFCKKCNAWKPPRAHHCSVMGRCVLRMDHYCIWVLNCVGLLNYKPFLLFLLYTFLATALAAAVLVRPGLDFLHQRSAGARPGRALGTPLAAFCAFVVDAAFAISLTAFLALHGRLVLRNVTTIEQFEKASVVPWPFDRGLRSNLAEVMLSPSVRSWLVPSSSAAEVRAALTAALTPRP